MEAKELGHVGQKPKSLARMRSDHLNQQWMKNRDQLREQRVPFTMIYKPFLKFLSGSRSGTSLTGIDCATYFFIAIHANPGGESWHSVARMADSLGVSESTIERSLRRLRQVGLIERVSYGRNSLTHTHLLPYGLDQAEPREEVED